MMQTLAEKEDLCGQASVFHRSYLCINFNLASLEPQVLIRIIEKQWKLRIELSQHVDIKEARTLEQDKHKAYHSNGLISGVL